MLTYSRNLLDQELIRDEGLKLRVYLDTAKPPRHTIGVGRNLDEVGFYPEENAQFGLTVAKAVAYGITQPEALAMLNNDITRCEAALDAKLPWWRTLCDVRQRILLNMVFNLGIAGLLKFTDTLAAIQRGAWATAAAAMRNSLWASQVGDRATRLAQMMEMGESL